MEQIPSEMRTGLGAQEETDVSWVDEFMFKVHIVLRTLIEDVAKTAAQYAHKAGRNVVVDEDFRYALMWESRQFATRPDLDRRIEETYETTMQELAQVFPDMEDDAYDEDSDAETGSSKENDPDGDSGEESSEESSVNYVPPEESPPFCRATDETDPFVRAIHEAVDTWDQWNPDDPVERIFKHAIDRIDVSQWHIPSASDIEEDTSDGESG